MRGGGGDPYPTPAMAPCAWLIVPRARPLSALLHRARQASFVRLGVGDRERSNHSRDSGLSGGGAVTGCCARGRELMRVAGGGAVGCGLSCTAQGNPTDVVGSPFEVGSEEEMLESLTRRDGGSARAALSRASDYIDDVARWVDREKRDGVEPSCRGHCLRPQSQHRPTWTAPDSRGDRVHASGSMGRQG